MTDTQEENREFLNQVDYGEEDPGPGQAPEPKEAAPEAPHAQEQAQEPEPEDSETRAREIGWRPKDEFKGDPSKWVDADAYLEKGEILLPILKKDREKLFKEVASLKKQQADFMDYHKQDRERVAKREYERGLAEIKAKQREAVESGDVIEFEKTEKDREALEQTFKEGMGDGAVKGAAQQQQEHPSLTEWRKSNEWFGKDPVATQYASTVSNFVLQKNPQWTGTEHEFFDAVKEETRRMYPDLIPGAAQPNPRRAGPQGVEGNEFVGGRSTSGKKSFNDLPQDARAQCQNLEKQGFSRADFVAEYFGAETIKFND